MGTRKVKLILIVLLIIAVMLLGVFWFLSNQSKQNNSIVDLNNTQNNIVEETPDKINNAEGAKKLISEKEIEEYISKVSETDRLKSQLQKIAVAFTERYGSYSNQSNFENLEDLTVFMTRSFKSNTENFVDSRRRQQRDSSIYYGMTTKVLNSKVEIFSVDTNFVKFNISTQKQEMIGSSANANTFYQNAEIELKQEAGVWKVDKITWL